jgi:polyphosphate kinase 2 (PPK2 family)
MRPKDFAVLRRPHLARIKHHPKMEFADYERRLHPLQSELQVIQQAYLGTTERALLVLEGHRRQGRPRPAARLGARSAQLQGASDRSTR